MPNGAAATNKSATAPSKSQYERGRTRLPETAAPKVSAKSHGGTTSMKSERKERLKLQRGRDMSRISASNVRLTNAQGEPAAAALYAAQSAGNRQAAASGSRAARRRSRSAAASPAVTAQASYRPALP